MYAIRSYYARFPYDAVVAYLRGYGADYVVTYDKSTDRHYPRFTESISYNFV